MLYLNGVYDANGYFWPVKPPTCGDLDVIPLAIATRVSRFLEKAGYLVRDAQSEYLDLMQDEEEPWVRSWVHLLRIAWHSAPMLAGRR